MSLNSFINTKISSAWPVTQSTFLMASSKCLPVDAEVLHPIRASIRLEIPWVDGHRCWETFTNRFHHSFKINIYFKLLFISCVSRKMNAKSIKTIKWLENACSKQKSFRILFISIVHGIWSVIICRAHCETLHSVEYFNFKVIRFHSVLECSEFSNRCEI